LEVIFDGFLDLGHVFKVALIGLKDEDVIVTDHLCFFVFVGSDSEVAEVLLDVHTAPVLEHWDHTGEESEWHAVSISGGTALWCVCIDVRVNPNDLCVWHEPLHAGDRADGLGVVTAQDDGVEPFLESLRRLITEVHGGRNHIEDVFGFDLLFFVGES
jgi:hypothetical protein